MASVSAGVIVGHVPREFSCVFLTFLTHSGSINCTITGSRRYSADLAQGGLEVPCTYALEAANKEWVQKARKHLEDGAQVNDEIKSIN